LSHVLSEAPHGEVRIAEAKLPQAGTTIYKEREESSRELKGMKQK